MIPQTGNGCRSTLLRRAIADLHRAAGFLDRRAVDPLAIIHELSFRAVLWAGLGAVVSPRTIWRIITELPGLASWDLQAALRERLAHQLGEPLDPLVSGLESADEEERKRRRRAIITSAWMLHNAGRPFVELVVCAAEDLAEASLRQAINENIPA
jgi:hypothetical protein